MSETLHPGYQDILTQNYHLFSRYLIAEDFLSELIGKEVLSTNDKDLITNPYVNQTRRQKATALIDVLLTKGSHGYDCFLEILEFQYPHVYKDVTKREPRPLPKGRHRNRNSDRLLLLENLPNLAAHIKEQFKQNEKLNMQLSVLEGLMADSHSEKEELEKDMESQKKIAKEREREAIALKADNKRLQEQVNRLHEEKASEMERSHKFRDERDDLQQKVQELLIEREQKKQSTEKRKPEASALPTISDQHIHEQNKILKQQLEEMSEQANEYADRLTRAEAREIDLRSKMKTVKQELEKELKTVRKDLEILEREKKELKWKNETYLGKIKERTDEKFALQDQKREVEDKVQQVERERQELFEETHRLKEQLQQAHSELERLKRSSQEMSSSAEEEKEDVIQRRTNVKCTDRKFHHDPHDQDSFSELDLDENSEPEEDLDTHKSNTLPTGSGRFDSPEFIFQQEVAHLRWSLKDKKPANISLSTEVQCGSMKKPVPLTPALEREVNLERTLEHKFNQPIFPANMILQDNLPERVSGPVVHSEDPKDANDKNNAVSSTSTGSLVPREPEVVRRKHSEPMSPISPTDNCGIPEVMRRKISEPMSPTECSRPSVRAICLSTELGSDFPSHDVYSVLLPRCLEVIRPSGIQSNTTVVTVKLPILNDKLELKGGNHTGIFVSKVHNKTCNIVAGDQIKEVIFIPNDVAEPVVTSLQGCTIDEAHRLLGEEFIRRRKEKEVKLRLRKSQQEYDMVNKWLVENGGTGDYFYIRCNYDKSALQQTGEETTLKPGEIFLVRDTCNDQRLWAGHRVNELTGDIDPQLLKILNKSCMKRKLAKLCRGISHDEEGETRHNYAFKVRGQVYERVLPMKASVKLPVILFGPDVLVEATMNLISNKLGQQFTVNWPGETRDPECFELYRQEFHSVWKGGLEKISSTQKHIQKITFLLKVTAEDSDSLRSIFGGSFSMTINRDTEEQCKSLEKVLKQGGFHIEELCFSKICTTETFLSQFRHCVQSSQDRILWLSQAEMDTSVAEKYLTYLGPDLSKVMLSLQQAQSMDETFGP